MTRRELYYENQELTHRVKELEQQLCPAEQHDYHVVEVVDRDYVRCVCSRCLKQIVRPDNV